MVFNDLWYSDQQCDTVAELARNAPKNGIYIEIGSWEGKSSIAIARAINDGRLLFCVDTWRGNEDESAVIGGEHPSVTKAKERDVFSTFMDNVRDSGLGNVIPFKLSWQMYYAAHASSLAQDIAFLHIDASHDYASVKATIETFLPHMMPGSVMCGDDYLTADDTREDLHGGVMRAVKELLPSHSSVHNMWICHIS